MLHRGKGWLPRRDRAAQRGSLLVVSFVFVIATVLVFSGLYTVLKEQMRQSLEIKEATSAKTQAFYLAEMGVNELMFLANRDNAFPAGVTFIDFTSHVKMTRGASVPTLPAPTNAPPASYPSAYAYVWVVNWPAAPAGTTGRQLHAKLKLANSGEVYEKVLNFAAAKDAASGHWVLSSYRVVQ